MFLTTHTIVATTIAVKTGNPYIYVPAAVANHFVLDYAPHFKGILKKDGTVNFPLSASIDAILGIGLFALIVVKLNVSPLLLFSIDLLASWPDLFLFYNRMINDKAFAPIRKFHEKIQVNESQWGVLIEIGIVGFCLYLLFR